MAITEYDPPERFVVGTVGPPGQRTFFLQAKAGGRLTSVSIEKLQVSVLADAATQTGLESVSCWAAVPHYAPHSPSPKATLALVSRLEELLDAPIDHLDLPEDARAWEHGVDELAQTDEEVAEYVESLEEAQDTADLPEASGDAIAREFERYLRRREDPPTGS
jgi:uncharacterized repeat protein (TIGR03847 family)